MTSKQLRELNYLLDLAAEEVSTKVLVQMLEVLKNSKPEDSGGLEELGYVAAKKLIERGVL